MNDFGRRLRDERERLGFSQEQLGVFGGVKKLAQLNYEKSERKPDIAYLEAIAKAGVDVAYVITGKSSQPDLPPSLGPDEQLLLDTYRSLSVPERKSMLARLLTGDKPPKHTKVKKSGHFNIDGEQNTVSIGGNFNGN